MPRVTVDEVVPFVVADERLRQHLRHQAEQRQTVNLRAYLLMLGVHDMGELNQGQLRAVIASRNLAALIDLLQIPRGRDLSGTDAHAAYDLHRPKTSLSPAVEEFLTTAPATDTEWDPLRDPEDIPHALPVDLLLRRLAPKEFLRRLTEGELLRHNWVDETEDQVNPRPEEDEDQAISARETAAAEDARPYGYLLLDASESMASARDHRTEIGRGLALAFLVNQYRSENPTYVTLFRDQLSPFFGGVDRMAFESTVAQVLHHPQHGMTNIQGALRTLPDRLPERTARTDVVLITDGLTQLSENPLGDQHLHSFVLGVHPDEFDAHGAELYKDSKLKLNRWGDFYIELSPEVMAKAFVPERRDALDAAKLMAGLPEELETAASPAKVLRLQHRLAAVGTLLQDFREYHSVPDPDIDAAWAEFQRLTHTVGSSDPVQVAMDHAASWTPIDRELMLALETKELASDFEQDPEILKGAFLVESPQRVSAWEALRLLLASLARRVVRRIKRMRPQWMIRSRG
jgi:hypothetical protein